MSKMFLFDLDGSIATSNNIESVLPANVEVIHQLKKSGHKIAIATGRSWKDSEKIADQIGAEYIILHGGACVRVNGQRYYESLVSNHLLIECIQKHFPYPRCVTLCQRDSFALYQDDIGWGTKKNTRNRLIVDYSLNESSYNAIVRIEDKDVKQAVQEVESWKDRQLSCHYWRGFVDGKESLAIELSQPNVNKFNAFIKLQSYLGFAFEDVVFLGDSWNDFELMKNLRWTFAPRNGSSNIKEMARHVLSCSNDEPLVSEIVAYLKTRKFL